MSASVEPLASPAGLEEDRARRADGGPALPRILVAVGLCVLPLIAVRFTPLAPDAGLLYSGLLPTFVAFTSGPRLALLAAPVTGVVMLVALLVSGSPAAAGVAMAAVGIGVAWSYSRGWQSPATYVATIAALATVTAPTSSLLDADRHGASSLLNAAVVAAITTVAGLWVAGVGAVLLRDWGRTRERPCWRSGDLAVFGGALGVLLGVTTFVIMQRTSTANAWWILLTILVTMTPDLGASPGRAAQRAGGTVVGGGVAALLVVSGLGRGPIGVIGLIAVVGSAVAYVRAPYWVFTATLTLALVLLTFPEGRVLRGDLERVMFTVAAAAIVWVFTVAVDRGLRAVRR